MTYYEVRDGLIWVREERVDEVVASNHCRALKEALRADCLRPCEESEIEAAARSIAAMAVCVEWGDPKTWADWNKPSLLTPDSFAPEVRPFLKVRTGRRRRPRSRALEMVLWTGFVHWYETTGQLPTTRETDLEEVRLCSPLYHCLKAILVDVAPEYADLLTVDVYLRVLRKARESHCGRSLMGWGPIANRPRGRPSKRQT